MSRTLKRTLWVLIAAAVVAGLVFGFVHTSQRRGGEGARAAPVAPPSRVQQVDGQAGVVLDDSTLGRAGILTSALATSRRPARISLPGELIPDPGQLTTIRAPISGRLTTAEGLHWPAVGERLTAGRVIAQVSDARPLSLARGGVVTEMSAQPGEIVQAGQVLLTLVDFDWVLARIVWRPEAPSTPPSSLSLAPLGFAHPPVRASLVGPAAEVDSLTRWPAFLYQARITWPGARPGLAVVGTFPDSRAHQSGVFVPAAAVVQWNGLLWIYMQRGRGRFIRVRLVDALPAEGGWLVATGVPAGATVVVVGAELLLSEEFRAGLTPPGEESEKR